MAEGKLAVEPYNDTVEAVVPCDCNIEAAGEVEVLYLDGLEVEIGDQLRLAVDNVLAHVVDEALSHHLRLHNGHVDAVDIVPVGFLSFVVVYVLQGG